MQAYVCPNVLVHWTADSMASMQYIYSVVVIDQNSKQLSKVRYYPYIYKRV